MGKNQPISGKACHLCGKKLTNLMALKSHHKVCQSNPAVARARSNAEQGCSGTDRPKQGSNTLQGQKGVVPPANLAKGSIHKSPPITSKAKMPHKNATYWMRKFQDELREGGMKPLDRINQIRFDSVHSGTDSRGMGFMDITYRKFDYYDPVEAVAIAEEQTEAIAKDVNDILAEPEGERLQSLYAKVQASANAEKSILHQGIVHTNPLATTFNGIANTQENDQTGVLRHMKVYVNQPYTDFLTNSDVSSAAAGKLKALPELEAQSCRIMRRMTGAISTTFVVEDTVIVSNKVTALHASREPRAIKIADWKPLTGSDEGLVDVLVKGSKPGSTTEACDVSFPGTWRICTVNDKKTWFGGTLGGALLYQTVWTMRYPLPYSKRTATYHTYMPTFDGTKDGPVATSWDDTVEVTVNGVH